MQMKYVILYVDSVADAMSFYERAFDLQRRFIHEGGDYGELATGETRLAFSATALMRRLGKTPAPASADRPSFEIAFETEDVAGSLKRAIDAGAQPQQDVREEPWGQTTAYVSDPFGYLIEICSPVQLPSPG